MLLAWRDKLRTAGVDLELAFVSIDEDERELKRFLDKQPAGGVQASYWIADESTQKTWFAALGHEETPALPVHAFVSPAGKLACVVNGVLEPTDFEAVRRLVQ